MTKSISIFCTIGLFAIACGQHRDAGEIQGAKRPDEVTEQRIKAQHRSAAELNASQDKQILFGDLHVHTTFSSDAFMFSLPMMQGEGARPVADACDFARYCSGLDYWSINDHAESLTPERWQHTKDAIRQCNAVAGDPENPDVVAFLGWEWTQVGHTPATHYGHKNVILRDLEEGKVPKRPIFSEGLASRGLRADVPKGQRYIVPLLDFSNRQDYFDLTRFIQENRSAPICATDVHTTELPVDCMEGAATPVELFRKLNEWGHAALVIPHGTTWGIYTPPGSTWDKQLVGEMHDPERQTMIEVYSGHGNSEEYREFRSASWYADKDATCPEPTDGFESCCWRAGEIIRARCDDANSAECEALIEKAKRNFLQSGARGRLSVPGTILEDWKDCGVCRDCFLPSMNYRPGGSAQYITALSDFSDPINPRRFRFGFMASSDNHRARPGTGYKEASRRYQTDAAGPKSDFFDGIVFPKGKDDPTTSTEVVGVDDVIAPQLVDFERQASFFMTGGLAAVHASSRSRTGIWDAFERREVYGTSGPRILLWFDILNGTTGEVPMGSEVQVDQAPRFRVRAVGSFMQKPGCPDGSAQGLPEGRLDHLCRGECYYPSSERHPITRIEVVRIKPQVKADEDILSLIEDPWLVLPCAGDASGCVAEFEDPEQPTSNREYVYYVRAIQAETQAINAGNVRCRYDENGACIEAKPCYGSYRTDVDDDCLAPVEERAWSSPIYVSSAMRQ